MLPVSLSRPAGASAGDSFCDGVSEGLRNVFVWRVSESGPERSSVCLVAELVVDEGSVGAGPSSEEMGSSVVETVCFASDVGAESFVVKDAIPAVVLSRSSSAAEPDCPAYHHPNILVATRKSFVILY